MKVKFTKYAKTNLDEIYSYLKDKGYGLRGRKIRAAILGKILKLTNFPEMGPIEPSLEMKGEGHRFLIEGKYKVIYKVEEEIILITDVFHTSQNPNKMKP